MLPWEHAAVAYLCYSGYARWRYADPPEGWPVLVVLFASQLPDLVDKPLAWYFHLLPSGRSLGHSIFIGLPLLGIVFGLASRRDESPPGAAFAIGYLSHLATDAVPLYPGDSTSFESVLWPVRQYEPSSSHRGGFVERLLGTLLGDYPSLLDLEPTANVLVGILMIGGTSLVWILDGTPGIRELVKLGRCPIDAIRSVIPR